MDLVFIGTSGSVPTPRRGLPSLLLRHGSTRILFDCGEGTQRQLGRSVGLVDVDAIFITHYHADHWLGLPGLLKTFDLRERERPLEVFGPPGLSRILDLIDGAVGSTNFELRDLELDAEEEIEFPGFVVKPFNVRHRGIAFGYSVCEPERPGKIDLERAAAVGLKPGPDLGKLQNGEPVGNVAPEDVMGPARPGRKIVISGDTSPCDAVRFEAHRAEVLIHEATFADSEADRASAKGHSTARQAAEIASEAGVGLLALTHISSRYGGREHRDEAREVFGQSYVARDFDSIVIPVGEKGAPEMVRENDRKQRDQTSVSAGEPSIFPDGV